MSESPHLGIGYLAPSQAQKHVTVNEAFRRLDALVQLGVLDRDRTAPPGTPDEGDRHIVAAGATGAWAGEDGHIAAWLDGAWTFIEPRPGWLAYDADAGEIVVRLSGAWVNALSALTSLEGLERLGVNATPDLVNRLAVASDAVLFNHDGAGAQVKLNKHASGDDAGFVFQTGFSSRALLGLLANDDFALKVSPDGAAFADVLKASASTGHVSLLNVLANTFQIRDNADPTKIAAFSCSGLTTGTTRTYTLPNASSTLAVLGNVSQTFTGSTTFSSTTATVGSATGASTYGLGSGATTAATTKTVNIGTAGVSGSITNLNLGSSVSGALGTMTVSSPTVTFASTVTAIGAPAATVSVNLLGAGGATADATNRLSVNTPAVLFNHAGASVQTKLNKNAAADDAGLVFQTGFSTRALFGLLANDDFTVKVSPDGSAFHTAVTFDRNTGAAAFAGTVNLAPQASDPGSPANGDLWYNSTSGTLKARINGATALVGARRAPSMKAAATRYIQAAMWNGINPTTVTGVANTIAIYPFVLPYDYAVTSIGVNVATAGAGGEQGKIVVYDSDVDGRPNNRILETDPLAFDATGVKEATVSLSFREGVQYWVGVRWSGTATISSFQPYTTPMLDYTAITTTSRKTLVRTLAFGTAAPGSWSYSATESSTTGAPAVWFKVG